MATLTESMNPLEFRSIERKSLLYMPQFINFAVRLQTQSLSESSCLCTQFRRYCLVIRIRTMNLLSYDPETLGCNLAVRCLVGTKRTCHFWCNEPLRFSF